ncbi:MAG: hypothetical protein KF893_12315 [Caldilineaceae bacterium]|nr:hypothetical protein [Caldilineaceae bacterium]
MVIKRILLTFSFFMVVLWCTTTTSESASLYQVSPVGTFTPPSLLTVTMFRLTASGGSTGDQCTLSDTSFGCTAFVGNPSYNYPYSTNPALVLFETDYLLDVVPQEMGLFYHPTALHAQAVAARSYAYWHHHQDSAVNNSISFQAFIPYKFESLTPATFPNQSSTPCSSNNLNTNQLLICGATAPRHYISYEGSLPAFTEFAADAYANTVNHPQLGNHPYMLGVADPISTACDANNFGHQRGMSQEGASRWARGNQCSYAGAGNIPWSVRWEHGEQILTHYYTGIQIRDVNNSSNVITPNARWVPLEIDWKTAGNQPPQLYHGSNHSIRVRVQNTGVGNWNCTYPFFTYNLRYQWRRAGQVHTALDTLQSLCPLAKGNNQWVDLTLSNIPNWGPGAYTLRLDMVTTNATGATCSDVQAASSTTELWFGDDCGWPPYEVAFCVDGPCRTYLPYLKK